MKGKEEIKSKEYYKAKLQEIETKTRLLNLRVYYEATQKTKTLEEKRVFLEETLRKMIPEVDRAITRPFGFYIKAKECEIKCTIPEGSTKGSYYYRVTEEN